MKKNTLHLRIIGCVVMVLLLVLPSHAQDTWPEDCQLPDLEEAMNAANAAQADGDTLAYLDSLRGIAYAAHDTYARCLGEIARSGDDLVGLDLADARLQGADLHGANLQEADLRGANFKAAHLSNANLQYANLTLASLEGAVLHRAQLRGADLTDANLQGANLTYAGLEGVTGESVDLRGADLHRAYLPGADLTSAIFDETTSLPNDSRWTPATDITRFTNPEHPDFWDPCADSGSLPWYCLESSE